METSLLFYFKGLAGGIEKKAPFALVNVVVQCFLGFAL